MKFSGFFVVLILLALCLTFVISCDCGDDEDDDDDNDDNDDDNDDDDDDNDTNDDDTSDDDTSDDDTDDDDDDTAEELPPLSSEVTTLMTVNEIAVLLPGADPSYTGKVWDDNGPPPEQKAGAELGTITDSVGLDRDEAELITTAVTDIDGDYKQELLVLTKYKDSEDTTYKYMYWLLTIIDDAEHDFAVLHTIDSKDLDNSHLGENESYLTTGITVGDFDGDNIDEILITNTYGENHISALSGYDFQGAIYWIFDDAAASYALLRRSFETIGEAKYLDAAAGDIDNDGLDEIVLMGKIDTGDYWPIYAWVMDDSVAGWTELHSFHDIDYVFDTHGFIGWFDLAIGDVDGDGQNDFVFMGNAGNCELYVEVFGSDYQMKYQKNLRTTPSYCYAGDGCQLVLADINFDGAKDVLTAGDSTYEFGWHFKYYIPKTNTQGYIADDSQSNTTTPSMAAGDIDRDGRDEVFILDYYESSEKDDPVFRYRQLDWDGDSFEEEDTWTLTAPEEKTPLIALGDYDGDNMIVRYTGNHWLTESDPRIVVAMAMPPVWADIDQDRESATYVGYGESTSYTEETATEVTVSAGITLSVSGGDPFGIIEAEASATMEQEFTKTETQTETVSLGIQRFAQWDDEEPDNYVVYSATLYHNYEYEIVAHPDPQYLQDGNNFMTIDVPLETNTFKKSVTAFNSNGDHTPIGDETFSHTLGDPMTYKTKEERDEILYTDPNADDDTADDDTDEPGPIYDEEMGASGWSMPQQGQPLIPVDEGPSGGTEISITLSTSNSSATSRSLGVSASIGVSVAGVGYETSVGFKNTDLYTVSVGYSTSYFGSVGEIHSDYWDDYVYKFGMFTYNYLRDDGMKYQIIDWCVEEY